MSSIEAAFSGRAGSVPELKTSASGSLWGAFSVAVGSGDDTTWIRVSVFGDLARDLSEKLQKGDKLYVEGQLKLSTWTGRDGEQRTGLQVAAHYAARMRPKANKPARGDARKADWQRPHDDQLPS